MARDGGSSFPKLGKVAQIFDSFQSISGQEGRGLAGVSNKWLHCVCPAGVQASMGVMRTAPLNLRREVKSGLRALAWRLCSLLRDFGPFSWSPCFSNIFLR